MFTLFGVSASLAVIAGWAASALMLCTFLCEEALMLRAVAVSANLAFIVYGALAGLAPVLVLHLVLIAVNLRRLALISAKVRGLSQPLASHPAALRQTCSNCGATPTRVLMPLQGDASK